MRTRKASDTIQLKLRFSEALRRRLERAKSDGRSLNSEIVHRLEQSFWLQVRLPERLRRRLEQAAKHHEVSMNTEIVDRLDSSLQREELQKQIGGMIELAVHEAASRTARRLVQELRESGLIPDQMARPLEASKHPAPPDKEEHPK